MYEIFSNVIGDASFIGLDCPTGIIDDFNDGTQESVPAECFGMFMAPEKTTNCGSKCSWNTTRTREDYKYGSEHDTYAGQYWLLFKSSAKKLYFFLIVILSIWIVQCELIFS